MWLPSLTLLCWLSCYWVKSFEVFNDREISQYLLHHRSLSYICVEINKFINQPTKRQIDPGTEFMMVRGRTKKIMSRITGVWGCKLVTSFRQFDLYWTFFLYLSWSISVYGGLCWFSYVCLDLFWFIIGYLGLFLVFSGHFTQNIYFGFYLDIMSYLAYICLFLAISGHLWLSGCK